MDISNAHKVNQASYSKNTFYTGITHYAILDFPSKFYDPLCITASGNILASGNISLKLFMAPLETIEPLTF